MGIILYPVLFKPIYKEMLWGGTRMRTLYHRTLPSENTGESWDITCRPNEMGIIENGPDAGLSFAEYIARNPAAVPNPAKHETFPLLVKIIDANADLSIQVHPDDQYAKTLNGMDTGKDEMWYVMEAPENGHLIIGLKLDSTRAELIKAIKNGKVTDFLHYMPVKKGDMIEIPAGLVHAITKGVIVAEVQQNSDITFRLHDYNRKGLDGKPRKLQTKEALEAIDFSGRMPLRAVQGDRLNTKYFNVVKYIVDKPRRETSDSNAFCVFTCVEGEGLITIPQMAVSLPLSRSVLIPAGMGAYEIGGKGIFLKISLA